MRSHDALERRPARGHEPYARSTRTTAYVSLTLIGILLAATARETAPKALAIGLALMFVTMAAFFIKPTIGICAVVFFTLIGDDFSAPWYPVVKGFSARESMMFISNKLIVSPLEMCLLAGVAALLVSYLRKGVWPFRLGPVGPALLALEFFVVVAVVYGVATGGDRHIALFQARPFFVFFGVFLLVASICRTRADYRHVLWSALAAALVHSIIALIFVASIKKGVSVLPESLFDHGAIMRMDVLIVVVIASWTFRGNAKRQRLTTTAMLLPVVVVYMISVRRSAIIALCAALILVFIVLFWRQRRTFMKVVPLCALLVAAYTGAFWNSQSSIAFPAQAVKSVISPGQATERNQGSDEYRTIENFDLNYTIRANKVLGLGLGKAFYRPIALPSLGGFLLNGYLPHNSILALWINFGFGGFTAFFCLLGRSLQFGGAKLRSVEPGQDLTVLCAFVAGIVIFVVFSSVDIAFGGENMTMFAMCLAAATNYPTSRRAQALAPGSVTADTVVAPSKALVGRP